MKLCSPRSDRCSFLSQPRPKGRGRRIGSASLSTVRLSVRTTMGTAEEIAAFLAPFPPFAELGRDDLLRAFPQSEGCAYFHARTTLKTGIIASKECAHEAAAPYHRITDLPQIGRASCRERVLISMVRVVLRE